MILFYSTVLYKLHLYTCMTYNLLNTLRVWNFKVALKWDSKSKIGGYRYAVMSEEFVELIGWGIQKYMKGIVWTNYLITYGGRKWICSMEGRWWHLVDKNDIKFMYTVALVCTVIFHKIRWNIPHCVNSQFFNGTMIPSFLGKYFSNLICISMKHCPQRELKILYWFA